jgi:outer membrane protein assembly factor BamE (lipoprotein component of BamABCDE complex)
MQSTQMPWAVIAPAKEIRMRAITAPVLARVLPRMLLGAGLAGAAAAMTASCAPLRSHQGYVLDVDLINSGQPGVDNRASVLAVLGRPTFASQFNQGDWYYLGRDSRNLAYTKPKATAQLALKISFDAAGTVTGVTRTGVEQIASINPDGKTTPTLGRKRGFFSELFGNIGSVGAAGAGGGQGGSNRDTP